MRFAILIALLIGYFTFSAPAHAEQTKGSRQSLEKAARKACIMGDYKQGTDILADLFIETNDLTYVYNQGRCFEQSHRWEEALDRFREYQRKNRKVSAALKLELEEHIAECKSRLAEQAPVPPSVAPVPEAVVTPPIPPAAVSPVPTASVPPIPPVAVATVSEPRPEVRQEGAGLRIAGIAAGAVGLAAIATGGILALKTGTLSDELNKQYNQDKAATRDSYETWGWVSYGVGAMALATGTTLFIIGWRSDKSQPPPATVSVVPVLGTGGPAVLLRGVY